MKQAHNTEAENDLTKEQAIAAMREGKKVTHRYFSDHEWITMVGNIIRMELGQECWATEFWKDRTGEHWENGWSIVPPTTPLPTGKDAREFTSGWKVINWGQVAQIRDDNHDEIAVLGRDGDWENGIPNETTKANAQRIVQAVNNFQDMLDALKGICEYEERGRSKGEPRIADKYYTPVKSLLSKLNK